jgi:hypothetical protein
MRPRNLRRKLRAWNRYANRLEKLGQQRIYNAHIHYIAADTVRHLDRCGGKTKPCKHLVEVASIAEKFAGHAPSLTILDEVIT